MNLRARRSAIAVLCVMLSLSSALAASQRETYPGILGIAKGADLSAEERQVEARFAAYLEMHTDEAISRYIAKYGNEISSDKVRELSIDYAPEGMDAEGPVTFAARTRWGNAVHEPASALTKELYRRALRKSSAGDRRKQVIFTAGGAGAGKTSSIHSLKGVADAVKAAEIIYDTTLSRHKSAAERIRMALDSGRWVSIVFVYRDPIESFVNGVLPRANINGRTVPLQVFIDTHIGAVEVFQKIADRYRNDPRVAVAVIHNRTGKDAVVADLGLVKSLAHKYSRENLKTTLRRVLEEAYEKGKKGGENGISENIYRAIKRDVP